MPSTESAVMNEEVTGRAKATATRTPRKKPPVDTKAVRAQISATRTVMAAFKVELKEDKAKLRGMLIAGRKDVLEATKTLKAVVAAHAKDVRNAEKEVASSEKSISKEQVIIDRLTAKLG